MKRILIGVFFLLATLMVHGKDSYYVVTSNSLNVRSEPNTNSSVLLKLKKNDEVISTNQYGEWLKINTDEGIGYVNVNYLSELEAQVRPDKPMSYNINVLLDKYVTWRNLYFWLVIVGAGLVCFALTYFNIELDRRLASKANLKRDRRKRRYFKDTTTLYFNIAKAGAALGLLYAIWTTKAQTLLIEGKLKIVPIDQGLVAWLIWLTIVITVVFFVITFFRGFKNYGRYAIFHFLRTFPVLIFVFISSVALAIGMLYVAIAGAVLYLIFGKSSSGGGSYSSASSSTSSGKSPEEKQREFEKRREAQEESRAYHAAMEVKNRLRLLDDD